MKPIIALTLAAALAIPAAAQTTPPEDDSDVGQGVDLLNEGARLLFRGLLDEVEPAMRDMARQLQDLNWNGIKIEDLDDYHGPEVLPNGDIILRRKTPKVEPDPDAPQIDL